MTISVYSVGEVVFAKTKQRKGKPQPGWKYHFCICSIERLYLFICGDKLKYDYDLTKQECFGLPNEVSFISLNGLKHVPDDTMRTSSPKSCCVVSKAFLANFAKFVSESPFLDDKTRKIILKGLKPTLD